MEKCPCRRVMFCSGSLATVSARTTIGRSDGKVNFAAEATSGKASKTSKTSSKMGFARNPLNTMLHNRLNRQQEATIIAPSGKSHPAHGQEGRFTCRRFHVDRKSGRQGKS